MNRCKIRLDRAALVSKNGLYDLNLKCGEKAKAAAYHVPTRAGSIDGSMFPSSYFPLS